jgi:dTDP-4-dehydrorhamnose 3,5-epimerase
MEVYKLSDFVTAGVVEDFVQDNQTRSVRGVLRGLHYQRPPKTQGRLVRVLSGEIMDVLVDLRRGSPAFGKWVGVTLSAKNRRMVYVPRGCAHGIYVLSDEAVVAYKATEEYAPELEAGIIWNDPDLAIDWPVRDPILSRNDRNWPLFKNADIDFEHGR